MSKKCKVTPKERRGNRRRYEIIAHDEITGETMTFDKWVSLEFEKLCRNFKVKP